MAAFSQVPYSVLPHPADALAIADIVVDKAIAASPNGVEGLELPSHLISLKDGQLDLNAVATPVRQQVAELGCDADVSGVAAGLGLRWPVETPLQMLSIPVTTSHCCTAGISLLRALPASFATFSAHNIENSQFDCTIHQSACGCQVVSLQDALSYLSGDSYLLNLQVLPMSSA